VDWQPCSICRVARQIDSVSFQGLAILWLPWRAIILIAEQRLSTEARLPRFFRLRSANLLLEKSRRQLRRGRTIVTGRQAAYRRELEINTRPPLLCRQDKFEWARSKMSYDGLATPNRQRQVDGIEAKSFREDATEDNISGTVRSQHDKTLVSEPAILIYSGELNAVVGEVSGSCAA
jgi:hypothetical protein